MAFIGEDKALDKGVEGKINELKTNYPIIAGILERFHKMELRDTALGLLGIDAMESLLKLRMLLILAT